MSLGARQGINTRLCASHGANHIPLVARGGTHTAQTARIARAKHGYAIGKEVAARTDGQVQLRARIPSWMTMIVAGVRGELCLRRA